MRRALALTLLLVIPFLPSLPAAPIVPPPAHESLLEGHTVFSAIEVFENTSTWTSWPSALATTFAAAAAQGSGSSGGGVRWFNDQDLVGAPFRGAAVAVLVEERVTQSVHGQPRTYLRQPCTGAVVLTDASYPGDPIREFASWGGPVYLESYRVTDPADHAWDVDMWLGAYGLFWVAPINGATATMGQPDDGFSRCAPRVDRASAAPVGDNGYAYPGRTGPLPFPLPTEGGLRYNALIVVPFDLLADAPFALRDHREGTWHRAEDATACHAIDCPRGDDDAEGNSHAHNWVPDLMSARPSAHGGGADCGGDGATDDHCHELRGVRLHYGPVPAPLARHYVVMDTAGSGGDW